MESRGEDEVLIKDGVKRQGWSRDGKMELMGKWELVIGSGIDG